jgi:hypothetical protein
MVLEPALDYPWHWTRCRNVLLVGTVDAFCAIILCAILIQLGAALVEPFEMRVTFLWRVRVRRKA